MSNFTNREERGTNNPLNNAYTDTVADYGTSAPDGDNVISNVTCDASVSVGSVVRMNGSTAVNAIANNLTNSQVIGICVGKPTSTTCNILTCGYTGDIFSGLSSTLTYYLSDTTLGQLTSTPPTSSGSYVIKIGKTQNGSNIVYQLERIVKRA